METQQTGIEKYHNDEKVMREVKSISERAAAESTKVRQEFMKRRYGPPGP